MFTGIGTAFSLLGGNVKFALVGIIIATILATGGISYGVGHLIGHNKGKVESQLVIEKFKSSSNDKIINLQNDIIDLNNKSTVEYIDRVNTIREKEYVWKDQASGLKPTSEMSKGWVYIHDKASAAQESDPVKADDETASGVMDNHALSIIVSNYARCTQSENDLLALQNWILEYNNKIKNSNKDDKQ